jgi:small subunit ribosomal protein S16
MASMLSSSFTTKGSVGFSASLASTDVLKATRISAAVPSRGALVTEAQVRLRFTRMGRNKAPFYRIIAIDRKERRDGRPLEYLGYYNPMTKETNLNAPAIKKWIETGAQPTDTVRNLLKKALIV